MGADSTMQDSLLSRYVRNPATLSEQVTGDVPRIASINAVGDEVTLSLEITPELAWFEGHFPDQPVLAGIIQVHWAAEVASALYGLAGPPQHIKRLKFSNVIVPPRTVELVVAKHGISEVQFTMRSGDQQHAQGRLVFPGTDQ